MTCFVASSVASPSLSSIEKTRGGYHTGAHAPQSLANLYVRCNFCPRLAGRYVFHCCLLVGHAPPSRRTLRSCRSICMRRSRGSGVDPHRWRVKCGSLHLDDVTRSKETTPDHFSWGLCRPPSGFRGGLDDGTDGSGSCTNDRRLSSAWAMGGCILTAR